MLRFAPSDSYVVGLQRPMDQQDLLRLDYRAVDCAVAKVVEATLEIDYLHSEEMADLSLVPSLDLEVEIFSFVQIHVDCVAKVVEATLEIDFPYSAQIMDLSILTSLELEAEVFSLLPIQE